MSAPRLLLFGTDQTGSSTTCSGMMIAQSVLRQMPAACVLAVTDADGIGELVRAERFDHIRLSQRGTTLPAIALRRRMIREILQSYEPDIVVALRSADGPDRDLFEALAHERSVRPRMRTALVVQEDETEATQAVINVAAPHAQGPNELFDEIWPVGSQALCSDGPISAGARVADLLSRGASYELTSV